MALTQHQQLYEMIQKSERPLITFKKDFNGDTIATSLALAELFKKLGKEAEIISSGFVVPHHYRFLPRVNEIKSTADNLRQFSVSINALGGAHPQIDYKTEADKLHIFISPTHTSFSKNDIKINDSHFRHDVIIALNTPDLESLGALYEDYTDFFFGVPLINIDHAPENEHYGHFNFVNVTASSVSEMLYDFIIGLDANLMDETIATYLLTGMIEKTNSFKVPSVTPKSLNIASELIAAGAERESIVKNLYQSRTVGALKLWGRVLLNLKTDEQQKVAWAEMTEADFSETNSLPSDLLGVIEELIVSIPTVEITAIFHEHAGVKSCLLKSERGLNLRELLREHNPSGNKSVVRFDLTESTMNVLEKIKRLI